MFVYEQNIVWACVKMSSLAPEAPTYSFVLIFNITFKSQAVFFFEGGGLEREKRRVKNTPPKNTGMQASVVHTRMHHLAV